MPHYKYKGHFQCQNCGKHFSKLGTCRPKACPACAADRQSLKLVNKTEL